MKTMLNPGQRKSPMLMLAISCLLALTAMLSPMTAMAADTTVMVFALDNNVYAVNGELMIMDVSPTIVESRTMLPIRYAAEPLGADVLWDDATRKVTVSLGQTVMELWIGQSIASVNGSAVPIDPDNANVKPLIMNSRTMLPLRFVTETLGCDVQWDPVSRTATISTIDSSSDTGIKPDIKLPNVVPGDSKPPGVGPGDIKLPGEVPDPAEDTGTLPEIKLPGMNYGDITSQVNMTDLIKAKYDITNINDTAYYENYFGTVLTADSSLLSTPKTTYTWGVTNTKDMSLQYFTFFLKPAGKYEQYRADYYLDSSAKADLVMNIRKETRDGMVIKSLTLKPGETIKDVSIDIAGVNKLCIESELRINHGTVKKIVVGQPVFMNSQP